MKIENSSVNVSIKRNMNVNSIACKIANGFFNY